MPIPQAQEIAGLAQLGEACSAALRAYPSYYRLLPSALCPIHRSPCASRIYTQLQLALHIKTAVSTIIKKASFVSHQSAIGRGYRAGPAGQRYLAAPSAPTRSSGSYPAKHQTRRLLRTLALSLCRHLYRARACHDPHRLSSRSIGHRRKQPLVTRTQAQSTYRSRHQLAGHQHASTICQSQATAKGHRWRLAQINTQGPSKGRLAIDKGTRGGTQRRQKGRPCLVV